MSTHTHRLPIDIAGVGVMLDITFNFVRGRPATGPSYSSGGEPAEPAEIDITEVVVASEKDLPIAPAWLQRILGESQAVYEALGEAIEWGYGG